MLIPYTTLDGFKFFLQNKTSPNQTRLNIKNCVLNSLKDNQFSKEESEDCNVHLTHFLETAANGCLYVILKE
jgi:hypothetical protein